MTDNNRPKLIVKRVEAPTLPGGFGYVLHDENGRLFPLQTAVRIDQRAGETTRVTVEFHVDGDSLVLL